MRDLRPGPTQWARPLIRGGREALDQHEAAHVRRYGHGPDVDACGPGSPTNQGNGVVDQHDVVAYTAIHGS